MRPLVSLTHNARSVEVAGLSSDSSHDTPFGQSSPCDLQIPVQDTVGAVVYTPGPSTLAGRRLKPTITMDRHPARWGECHYASVPRFDSVFCSAARRRMAGPFDLEHAVNVSESCCHLFRLLPGNAGHGIGNGKSFSSTEIRRLGSRVAT